MLSLEAPPAPVDIDLDGLGSSIAAALAEPEPVAEPVEATSTRPTIRTGRRVTMQLAKKHFAAGGDVVVSERGHEIICAVTPDTTVHNIGNTTWKAVAEQVKQWRSRYPNQRYYIVPTPGTPDVTEPAPAAEPADDKPKFEIPRLEAHPSVMETIKEVVENVLGTGKAGQEKRDRLIADLGSQLADMPVYGIEVEGARIAIGDGADFGNATVETDGYGAASVVWAFGTPLWDPA